MKSIGTTSTRHQAAAMTTAVHTVVGDLDKLGSCSCINVGRRITPVIFAKKCISETGTVAVCSMLVRRLSKCSAIMTSWLLWVTFSVIQIMLKMMSVLLTFKVLTMVSWQITDIRCSLLMLMLILLMLSVLQSYQLVVSEWPTLGLFMAALRSRCGHYILALWFLSIFYLSFFIPRLISAVGDWMSTILPHMVWP